jgi:hypothetical protein
VSAVATILGLMLVVTFIANYLSTTLPQNMSIYDVNHDLLTENEVGRLSALLEQAASQDAVGAELSQPFVLGSQGLPPFAPQDAGSIGSEASGASENLAFTLSGPATYLPPVAGPVGGHSSGTGVCPTPTSTGFSDTGPCNVIWNFTGDSKSFSIAQTGPESDAVNVTTNSSTITVTGTGSGSSYYQFIGTLNTITMTGVGSGPMNVSVIGSSNSLALSTTGASPIVVYIYGNHDTLTVSSTGGGAVKVVVYGTQDTFSVPMDTGNQRFNLYLNGFNATAPTSSLCPYGNLSATDTVTGFTETGLGGLTEYVNNAVGYYANTTGGPGSCTGNSTCWSTHDRNVALTTCPFFTAASVPFRNSGVEGASIEVHLRNSYAPPADVAYDQGAVVFAQGGGIPVLVDPPVLSYSGSPNEALLLFVPQFEGQIGAEAGVGTAELTFQLISAQTLVFPSEGFSVATGTNVVITLVTPFAVGWMDYLHSVPSLSGLVSCTGLQNVCTANYSPAAPLGTITISVPVKTLTLNTAVFAVALT